MAHGILMCFKSYRKSAKAIPIKLVFMVAIPAICELTGSGLQNIALVYTPVSIFQILKGSVLIFSALFRRIFLRKKFSDSNWIGLCICVFALIPVGISHILSNRTPGRVGSAEIALGLGLVLAAQLIRGSQFVIEEYLLKPPHTLSPLVMIGVEGFWGTLLLVSFILPLLQHIPGSDTGGVMENTLDTFEMLHSSGLILALCVGLLFAFFIYKVSAALVTSHASSVHRSFLEVTRTVSVWALSVLMYYTSSDHHLGEALTWFSLIQAFGFIMLVYGQLVYDGIVSIPFYSLCFNNERSQVEIIAKNCESSSREDLEDPVSPPGNTNNNCGV